MDDELKRRKLLTFEQAEGAAPLPSQLARDELSPTLRARLFDVVYRPIKHAESTTSYAVVEPWATILYDKHVRYDGRLPSHFINDVRELIQELTRTFSKDHIGVLGLLQWFLRHPRTPKALAQQVEVILVEERSAYRLLDGDTLVPLGTEAEGETLSRALSDLKGKGFEGARAHLKDAATALGSGKFADSVRDSIHAVESVARVLAPSAKLSEALSELETRAGIHKAMKAGFNSLYGFTSDEKGIRHPLLNEGDAKVDEADALFMLGACAAFVSYLLSKARIGGLIK